MSEQTNDSAQLYAKLARIMGKTERIAKQGRNDFHHYDFVTDADVLDFFRPLFAAENVALLPRMVSAEQLEVGTTKAGDKKYKTRAKFEFTLVCGDTGATYTCDWYGESNDNEDKGINKAATAALKYWLLKTFMASTGDLDEDTDATGEDGKTQATTKPTPKPQGATVSNLESTRDLICSYVELKPYTDKKNNEKKLRVVYVCADGVYASSFTRKHASDAGYVVDTWTAEGRYDLPVPAVVTVRKNGDFWDVVNVKATVADDMQAAS